MKGMRTSKFSQLLKSLFILISIFGLHNIGYPVYGQAIPRFDVQLSSTSFKKQSTDYVSTEPVLYEDEKYVVKAYCYGEFGGGLLFRNKQTDSTYTCQATCTLSLFKLNGRYIASCTLAHMRGFAQVFEIADPRKMKTVPTIRKKRAKRPKTVVLQGELSTAGTKTLADSIGVQLAGSFPLSGRLYFIVTNSENTFLTTIKDGRFVTITKLTDFSTWSYNPTVQKNPDGHYLFFYKNNESQGYIDVHGTTINIIRYL